MGKRDPRIDAYIAKSAPFARPILKHLRETVHEGCPDVVETLKWSMPHFDHKGIFCGMAAFKEHATFGFWKHDLLRERVKGMGAVGEGAMGSFGRITSVDDLPPKKALLRVVKEGALLNELGIKAPKKKAKLDPARPLVVPAYFKAALRKNKKAEAAFKAFARGQQREYVDWLTEAKTDATRDRRLATAVEWIAEGKIRNWKYVKA